MYDQYFGDTTQQGINDDKQFGAPRASTALWPVNNYDQNQAAGTYIASFSFPGDTSYEGVAEGAGAVDGRRLRGFPYVVPLGVQQFAQATNSIDYQGGATGGRPEMKDWVNGYNFTRLDDFLDFFKNLAVTYSLTDANGNVICPNTPTPTAPVPVAACSYDPHADVDRGSALDLSLRIRSTSSSVRTSAGGSGCALQDLNTWIAADRDRNVATYVMMYNYTSDVLYGEDDGNIGAPYAEELPLKYYLNYTTAARVVRRNPHDTKREPRAADPSGSRRAVRLFDLRTRCAGATLRGSSQCAQHPREHSFFSPRRASCRWPP